RQQQSTGNAEGGERDAEESEEPVAEETEEDEQAAGDEACPERHPAGLQRWVGGGDREEDRDRTQWVHDDEEGREADQVVRQCDRDAHGRRTASTCSGGACMRSRSTPNSASRKMPRLILLSPTRRSSKVMGSSSTRKPSWMAR